MKYQCTQCLTVFEKFATKAVRGGYVRVCPFCGHRGYTLFRPTPVAPNHAEARDSDDESPTRAAGEHDG